MRTLCDKLQQLLEQRGEPLNNLLRMYDDEKDVAKCYSTFAYLSCAGAGGGAAVAEAMAELVEGFFMATSIHDDAADREDQRMRERATREARERADSTTAFAAGGVSPNTYVILGDCFFVRIATALARATADSSTERRGEVLQRFEQLMLDVAESQVADERTRGQVPSRANAVEQMRLRGGTWGRICTELPALAGGLPADEARRLGDAGESLFLGLTIRDDLRDLQDDIRNGVLTLAPALLMEGRTAGSTQQPVDPEQADAMIDLMVSDGAIARALEMARNYTGRGLDQLGQFLAERDAMHWFLLQMIFRLTHKRIREFTPTHVLQGELAIGFAALRETLDAQIDG